MQFSRLRLSGFKSFVDPTELHVEPGLTGIVGPNGCGKSNLMEALRWAMGENSARSMRAGGMDDVIFAGTESRPARNLAEVVITLDNTDRKAPAAFNDSELLEVSRRIERESGSAYRINGAEVRARDVQLLFADAATGAHSPALVSQGRVGALIAAKPRDRRAILEEAAGISGLHSRRKEAEQRLRAADSNLERLQDVLTQLEGQIGSLKRQARQARRYRTISGDIRKVEAGILYRRWQEAQGELERLSADLKAAEAEVRTLSGTAASLGREQADLSASLPAARQAEAEAAAVVQRVGQALKSLEDEERRRQDRLSDLARQAEQISGDRARETESLGDASAALERLEAERDKLTQADDARAEAEAAAKERLADATARATAAEQAFDETSRQLTEARGRHASLNSDLRTVERRCAQLAADLDEARAEIARLEGEDAAAAAVRDSEARVAAAEGRLSAADEAVEAAERRTSAARDGREAAQGALTARRQELASIDSEISALEKRLAAERGETASIADSLRVEPGFEAALGAALGSDLDAPESPDAPVHWQTLPEFAASPEWPAGIRPMIEMVSAPAALARRLAHIGVIEDRPPPGAVESLQPGQRLVSRGGAMWRWDGLVAKADAPTAAALRLEQKNRLAELAGERDAAARARDEAEAAFRMAEKALADAQSDAAAAARAQREAQDGLRSVRKALGEAEAEASRTATRLASLKESLTRLEQDMSAAQTQKDTVESALAALPDPAALEVDLQARRRAVEESRAALAEARAAHDALNREAQARRDRLAAIVDEHAAWTRRLERAENQIAQYDQRAMEVAAETDRLAASPEDIDKRRSDLDDELQRVEAARKSAADELARLESALAEKDTALKAVQEDLATARENRARVESAAENATQRKQELERACGESYRCPPAALPGEMELGPVEDMPAQAALEGKLDKLKAERERLGAVNLRADEELVDLEEQHSHLVGEKEDLEGAIARLRRAISDLNREGRERLLTAFEEVNTHFADLFATLFGGGHAYLELVDSDDPLDAGIEIMASPPGKRLQSLSLLSGGEQALTALSLIFAVFMTNPAPICVLDEVDAPLDEANVERFCDLLDAMCDRTATRFLIITHNEVTMARMHRLFGVTMAERGVSQLVSVSLERAGALAAE